MGKLARGIAQHSLFQRHCQVGLALANRGQYGLVIDNAHVNASVRKGIDTVIRKTVAGHHANIQFRRGLDHRQRLA